MNFFYSLTKYLVSIVMWGLLLLMAVPFRAGLRSQPTFQNPRQLRLWPRKKNEGSGGGGCLRVTKKKDPPLGSVSLPFLLVPPSCGFRSCCLQRTGAEGSDAPRVRPVLTRNVRSSKDQPAITLTTEQGSLVDSSTETHNCFIPPP
jgi:hypothetical protein